MPFSVLVYLQQQTHTYPLRTQSIIQKQPHQKQKESSQSESERT